MAKTFEWCPREAIGMCLTLFPDPHSHICIRGVGAPIKSPQCGNPVLQLEFDDRDPDAIRRTEAFANDPIKGQEIVDRCMNSSQAIAIVEFVEHHDGLIVVNCAAGISRSPGVVLALRRHYGGDEDEVFQKAHPNIHVTSMISRALPRRNPMEAFKAENATLRQLINDGGACCNCEFDTWGITVKRCELHEEMDSLKLQVEHWKGNATNANDVLTKTTEKLAVAELQVEELRNDIAFSRDVELKADELLRAAQLQVEGLQKIVDAAVKKYKIGHLKEPGDYWKVSAELDLILSNYTEKPKRDTCENYRRDGETEVRPRFCSMFEANSQVHAPTCQFAEKRVDDQFRETNQRQAVERVAQLREDLKALGALWGPVEKPNGLDAHGNIESGLRCSNGACDELATCRKCFGCKDHCAEKRKCECICHVDVGAPQMTPHQCCPTPNVVRS